MPGLPPKFVDIAGLKSLRTRRTLKAGVAITVEPGCYFNTMIFEKAFANPEVAKYLVKEVIQ